jgi:hypothetical protein
LTAYPYPELFALSAVKKLPNKQQLANIIVAIYEGCRSNFVKLKIVNFCRLFQASSLPSLLT